MASSVEHLFTVMSLSSIDRTTREFRSPVERRVTEPSTSAHNDTTVDLLEVEDIDVHNLTAVHRRLEHGWPDLKAFYELFTRISGHEWVIFSLIVLATVLVIALVVGICVWICKHKKRVIARQNEPIVADYEDSVAWPRCFCCCRRNAKQMGWERHASASNLDHYRRPRLPPIRDSSDDQDGYLGSYVPPSTKLPPLPQLDLDDPRLGIHITNIKDVPHTPLHGPPRPLPQLKY